jgi:photosystem II stability/assembly factor-like uncharacterized protein
MAVVGLATSVDGAPAPWHAETVPAGVMDYEDVACASASVCEAVGDAAGTSVISRTTDGGATWSDQALPSGLSGKGILLLGVTCESVQSCKVVGQVLEESALILSTSDSGTTWNVQATPDLAWLNSVACPSSAECVAVGETKRGKGTILGTTDDGVRWEPQAVPAGLRTLQSVSCSSASVCTAVGFAGDAPNYTGSIVRTADGGEVWSTQWLAKGPGLTSVTCPSATACVAVGDTTGHAGAILSTTDSGTSWRSQPLPTPTSDLYAVSCRSAQSCVAVGVKGSTPHFDGVIEATADGGSAWTSKTVPRGVSSLSGVQCRPSPCVAVGYSGNLAAHARGVIIRQG